MSVGERCKTARKELKMSQQELADAVSRLGFKIGQSAIGNLESGKTKTPLFLHELAQALNVSTEWLRYGTGDGKSQKVAVQSKVASIVVPTIESMARDIPVLGTASGGNGQVLMRGDAIDYVRRPPSLAGRTDVFALYIEDVSMVPAFNLGDLVFVERRRPRVGDHCIVEYQSDAKNELRCIIKKLAGVTPTSFKFEQYNPHKILEIKTQAITKMQRVMTMSDLFVA